MTDIVAFIEARLDEDEQVARAATAGPWEVDDAAYAEAIYANDRMTSVVAGGRWGGEASVFNGTEDALHIARHDPARVLREVEAKRKQISALLARAHFLDDREWYGCRSLTEDDQPTGKPCTCGRDAEVLEQLAAMASAWSDHPDFQAEWRLTL